MSRTSKLPNMEADAMLMDDPGLRDHKFNINKSNRNYATLETETRGCRKK
jgi:hypothetical protein